MDKDQHRHQEEVEVWALDYMLEGILGLSIRPIHPRRWLTPGGNRGKLARALELALALVVVRKELSSKKVEI